MIKKYALAASGLLALAAFIALMIWLQMQGPAIHAEPFPRPS